jgi:hypothetical protein
MAGSLNRLVRLAEALRPRSKQVLVSRFGVAGFAAPSLSCLG